VTGRAARNLAKGVLRRIFELGQRIGLDVLPRHMYSEIPDVHALRSSTHWRQPYSMAGIGGADIAAQLSFARSCCTPQMMAMLKSTPVHADAVGRNGEEGFGPTESEFLFAFVATRKPRQIFQVGCGVSTAVCLAAAARAGHAVQITCVDPYPTPFLQAEARAGRITLLREKVEALDPARCASLEAGALFFVDSTHALGPAGEVSRLVLEWLPRLRAGTFVHFHDIKFPYDYDRHTLDSTLFFQHESVLLQAFLACNPRFRILASLSMLHYADPRALGELLPNYRPARNADGLNAGAGHFPSSTYLEVIG
jgi:hypothetical protein